MLSPRSPLSLRNGTIALDLGAAGVRLSSVGGSDEREEDVVDDLLERLA
jgi:hypothetical protein